MAKEPRKGGKGKARASRGAGANVEPLSAPSLPETETPVTAAADVSTASAQDASAEAGAPVEFEAADEGGEQVEVFIEEVGPSLSASLEGPAAEVKDQTASAVEGNVEAARSAFHRAEEAAERASQSLTTSYAAAVKGMVEINARTVDAWRATAISTLQFIEALMGTKSIAEAIALQTTHVRRQFEIVSGQAKDMAALARKVASAAAEPLHTAGREGPTKPL